MLENSASRRFNGEGQAQAIIERVEMHGVRIFDTLKVANGVCPFADLSGIEVVEFITEVAAHGFDVVFHARAVVVALDPNRARG